jgi:hypothetical protein
MKNSNHRFTTKSGNQESRCDLRFHSFTLRPKCAQKNNARGDNSLRFVRDCARKNWPLRGSRECRLQMDNCKMQIANCPPSTADGPDHVDSDNFQETSRRSPAAGAAGSGAERMLRGPSSSFSAFFTNRQAGWGRWRSARSLIFNLQLSICNFQWPAHRQKIVDALT